MRRTNADFYGAGLCAFMEWAQRLRTPLQVARASRGMGESPSERVENSLDLITGAPLRAVRRAPKPTKFLGVSPQGKFFFGVGLRSRSGVGVSELRGEWR